MRRSGTTLLFALCLVLISSTVARATFPGKNGRIAFATDNEVVKTINKDGSDLRRVVANAADPAWSPHGTKIAFTAMHKSGPLGCSIEISRPDGTGIVDLGGSRANCDFGPAFTPDGKRIFYIYDDAMGHQAFRRMSVQGRNITFIRSVPSGLEAHPPTLSPDGTTMAMELQKMNDTERALFTLGTNGKHRQQLTPFDTNVGTLVDWSPNGRWIVFTEYENDGPGNIVLIHPDGSGARQLTHRTGDV